MVNKELLESTELYEKRYRNFSTIIIIPTFILILGMIFFIFIGKMNITVNGSGNIMPVNKVINIPKNDDIVKGPVNNESINKGQKIIKYRNGRYLKSSINGTFYKNNDSNPKNLGSIYPTINSKNKLMSKIYVSSKDISSIKKGQHIIMSLPNNRKYSQIHGYVNDYSLLPIIYKGKAYYGVYCYLIPRKEKAQRIFYGMNGNITINTSRVSIAEYIKNIFN